MIGHDHSPEIGVLKVQCQQGMCLRTDDDGVGEVDVGLGFEKSTETFAKVFWAFAEFHDEKIASPIGYAALHKQGLHSIRVADNEPHDGDIH